MKKTKTEIHYKSVPWNWGQAINWLKPWRAIYLVGSQWSSCFSAGYRSPISFLRMVSPDWPLEKPELSQPHSHSVRRKAVETYRECTLESHSSGFKSQFHCLLAVSLWKKLFYLSVTLKVNIYKTVEKGLLERLKKKGYKSIYNSIL